jgi:hypothetical protein
MEKDCSWCPRAFVLTDDMQLIRIKPSLLEDKNKDVPLIDGLVDTTVKVVYAIVGVKNRKVVYLQEASVQYVEVNSKGVRSVSDSCRPYGSLSWNALKLLLSTLFVGKDEARISMRYAMQKSPLVRKMKMSELNSILPDSDKFMEPSHFIDSINERIQEQEDNKFTPEFSHAISLAKLIHREINFGIKVSDDEKELLSKVEAILKKEKMEHSLEYKNSKYA